MPPQVPHARFQPRRHSFVLDRLGTLDFLKLEPNYINMPSPGKNVVHLAYLRRSSVNTQLL